MEAFHRPSEAILVGLDAEFDPRRTRSSFLPFLAQWVDLHNVLVDPRAEEGGDARMWSKIDTGRLRELIANAAYLSQWRGTAKGLRMFLAIATGDSGFEIDERAPFHFRVRIPKALAPRIVMIERIIQSEKPAYVTYETELF